MTRPSAALASLLALASCSAPLQHKPLEMEPIGTVKNAPRTAQDDSDSGVTTPNSGTPPPVGAQGPCAGDDFEALDAVLEECHASMPKGSEIPSSLKDKLEVKLTPSSTSTSPGGHIDLTLVIRNKSNGDVPLFFTGDPKPRFEVEAVDAKGRRVDIPASKAPPWPKGTSPPSREVKASKITLAKGGVAKVTLSWDAYKSKWAPDRAKAWEGRGYPHVQAGPLPNGKYVLRVNLPLLGEVDVPKVRVVVG